MAGSRAPDWTGKLSSRQKADLHGTAVLRRRYVFGCRLISHFIQISDSADDGSSRAIHLAETTAHTVIVIDMRQVILNLDRLGRTFLGTLLTSDTSKIAGSHDILALFLGSTSHLIVLSIPRDHLNDTLRTVLRTHTAALALLLIDNGNSVYVLNRVELTGQHTCRT